MANRDLWMPLFWTALTVLLTTTFTKGIVVRIDEDTPVGHVLFRFERTQTRTNYSLLLTSPRIEFLRDVLSIDRSTGILRLKRRLDRNCALLNRIFIVTVRSTSALKRDIHFQTPITVCLRNRDCQFRDGKGNFNLPGIEISRGMPRSQRLMSESEDENRRTTMRKRLSQPLTDSINAMRHNSGVEGSKTERTMGPLWFSTLRGEALHRLQRYPVSNSKESFRQKANKITNWQFKEGNGRRKKRSNGSNPPKFAKSRDNASVREDVQKGTVVVTVSVLDTGSQGPALVYAMTPMGNINSKDFFQINSSTGEIRTTKELDRETMSEHIFRVTATSKSGPRPYQVSMVLTITVLDVNDNVPIFDHKIYTANISESEDIDFTVLAVRAYDLDFGTNKEIRYSILKNGHHNVFVIDHVSGIIRVNKKLDREKVAFYNISVKAEDQGKPSHSSTAEVHITLLDDNDCTPLFNESMYDFYVAENSPRGFEVGQVNATDCDIGLNKKIKYSITSGNDDQTFRIVANSGIIRVRGKLDYEIKSVYSILVTAEDYGELPEDSEVWVQISITDVNDNPPKFQKSSYEFKIKENADTGDIVGKVHADDRDSGPNGKVQYFLKSGNFPFEIERASGKIKTKGKLDREQVSSYQLEVIAQDNGKNPMRNAVSVRIIVEDVNDSPPYFTKSKYNASIPERYSPLRPFLTVSAKDDDIGDTITYSVEDVPDNCFSINRNTGGIMRTRTCRLDFKRRKEYNFKVIASDEIQNTSVHVTVRISDSNDNPPRFEKSTYHGTILENQPAGTRILQVNATDEDFGENARLTYSINHGDGVFKIHPVTGVITSTVPLDREITGKYKFRVIATDNGKRKKSGRARVVIKVKDINDNTPKFLQDSYETSLQEDVHVGTFVLQVKASDNDDGGNKQITYSIKEKGNEGEVFKVHPYLGDITVNKPLDRETTPSYILTVVAMDHGKPPRNSTTIVKIFIEDVIDSPPSFQKSRYVETVPENAPKNHKVVHVKAVTKDTTANGQIQYDITNGNYDRKFTISGTTGVILLAESLDYEVKTQYILTVQAMYASFLASVEVEINVEDINDMAPVLAPYFDIIINARQNIFPQGLKFRIPAYDPDATSVLTYEVRNVAFNVLSVDKNTGVLNLKESALVNTVGIKFDVRVWDGRFAKFSEGRIRLNVITKSMLNASVALYLKNVTISKFFLAFEKFKQIIGSVLGVLEKDIFVFGVVNKTRSTVQDYFIKEHYLTVWMTVKEDLSTDYPYMDGKLVLDLLFLNKWRLQKATGMILLPSDEEITPGKESNYNVEVKEACGGADQFFTCSTEKSFQDTQSTILTSSTVLFQGLDIKEVVRKVCPPGFYGRLCNFVLDSCYSNPCKGNGQCVNFEGGYYCKCKPNFAGKNCELDMKKSKCSSLKDNTCLNKGVCYDVGKSGFVCKCPNVDYDANTMCSANTRSFKDGSFVAFPGLKQLWQIDISLEFATIEPDGLLLYVGRYEHKNDVIAVELRNGKVYFAFSAGSEVQTISVGGTQGESLTNGEWHKISISYKNQIGALVLGDQCDTAVAVKFSNQVGNYSCAIAAKLKEQKKNLRSMDLTSPLFLGALPSKIDQAPIQGKHFDGCIRNIVINHVPLDLGSPMFDKDSSVGCPPKKDLCYKNPCLNKGKCTTSWESTHCHCPEGFANRTCGMRATSMDFTAKSFLITSATNDMVKLPWTMTFMLRTVQPSGTLVQMTFDSYVALLQLHKGTLHCSYHTFNMTSPNVRLDDGIWHHVRITWNVTLVVMVIDHVHTTEAVFQQGSILEGRVIKQVILGDAGKSGTGFTGCMKGVVFDDIPLNTNMSTQHLLKDGCSNNAKCSSNTCQKHSTCQAKWRRIICACQNGFVGDQCRDVCSLNPCQNGATCKRTTDKVSFKCICREKYLGQYCEMRSQLPCRDGLYSASNSFCGPCNCDLSLGYNPVCNKTTGFCYCQENHYRELLGGRLGKLCVRCNCDAYGSKSQTCDPVGGQCPCLPGVIGPHCDMCEMKQGEITQNGKGCKIINTSCPRAKAEHILWKRAKFGIVAEQKCAYGAQGIARRLCAIGKGWQKPDVTGCTTTGLIELEKLLKRSGNLTTAKAMKICKQLGNTLFARENFFQKDVAIGYRIIMALIEFESRQQEERLASSQDTDFLDTVLKAISRFIDKKYTAAWSLVKENPPATVNFMRHLEAFGISLASNIVHIKRNQFRGRRATSNLQSLNKFQPNLYMRLEPVNPRDFSGLLFSLEDVEESGTQVPVEWKNRTNRVRIPASLFGNPGAPKQESAIAFIVLKHLAKLLPRSYDIRESGPVGATEYSLHVNSDVVIIGIKGMEAMYLKEPITIEFENHQLNYSQYECVYWNYSIPGSNGGGWSTNGCSKAPSNTTHTICKCHHLTSFAVVSDLIIEPPILARYSIEIITYVGIAVSLALLIFAILSFTCLSGLNSNTNNIHRNMVVSIVIAELIYLFGINRTSNQLICRFIAIVLHYSFDAVFAWMFVEVVHMYRMLTEKRNIDSGQMTFYYFLGWGSPAIIVGLSTGMAVEGYGNDKFCWMTTNGTLIWTFAIPIAAVMVSNCVIFLMALSLSIKKARRRRKHQAYNPNKPPVTSVYKNALKIKYALKVGAAFLPILAITLIFGVLAVNQELIVFHYLFALLCCCQSLFVILFYVAFDPKVREEYKNAFIRWKTGDKTYGRPRRKRLFEKSYHPGSNLAGEDGYGLRGRNGETTSTDRSTSTLHSSSMTPFSTFPEDEDSDAEFKETKKRKPRKEDPVDMESAAKMWNAPEKSEVSTTQPESSESSDEGRRRQTMIISSDSGSSGEGSGSWEDKAKEELEKQQGTAPLYASDGPMHSTPLELEQEKARLRNSYDDKPVAKLPESKLPSILKNNSVSSPRTPQQVVRASDTEAVQPSPQPSLKTTTPIVAPKPTKGGSEASSGSSLSSSNDDDEDDDLVVQAKLLSQSTEGGMSTMSSKERKKKSRKSRDVQFGKKSRHHRVHFHRNHPNTSNVAGETQNADGTKKVHVKAMHLGEGKPLTGHHV